MTLKGTELEVPPKEPGVNTVMLKLPSSASKDAGRVACSCVPLMKLVVKAAPLTSITEVAPKLLPLTVKAKSELPSTAVLVLRLLMAGTLAGLGQANRIAWFTSTSGLTLLIETIAVLGPCAPPSLIPTEALEPL